MTYTLTRLLILSSSFVLLTACSSSQLYSSKDDIAKLNTKIETFEQSFQNTQTKNLQTQQEVLELFSAQQKELIESIQTQLHHIQKDQNTTRTLLQEQINSNKPKKIVVYKNKKEVSRYQGKLVLGQEENVFIEPPGVALPARVDTGAETSSIDARDLEEFERDGKKWVKFTLFERENNSSHTIETEISRYVKIIQSSLEDGYDRRIVVKLKLTLGDHSDLSEFTLTNREHMQFPVLLGRNVLKDIALVDVSAKHIAPLKKQNNND